MEKNANENMNQADNASVYELSYIVLPTINSAEVNQEVAKIKDFISKEGAEDISSEEPILIDLAYPMVKVSPASRHKVTSGYFGWMKFEMDRSALENLKKVLDNSESIVRYLIIKTVRENTLLSGKMRLQKEEKVRNNDVGGREDSEEAVSEVPEVKEVSEEVDKSIDELVIA
jgi:ribosomal protein S6